MSVIVAQIKALVVAVAVAVLVLAAMVPQGADAVTLTYKMTSHERACFYTIAKKDGEKLAFYYSVQNGGDYEVSYDVTAPDGSVMIQGKERQGDWVLSATGPGDYSFCFSNVGTTVAEKVIDFDITAQFEELDRDVSFQADAGVDKEEVRLKVQPLIDSAAKLSNALNNLMKVQKYIKNRESRNLKTVISTNGRLGYFGFLQCLILVAVAYAEVTVIERFFIKSGKMRV